MAAGLVTALLQHGLDAGVILGVVLINAAIGFAQKGKAEDTLRAIRSMLSPHEMVWRNGPLVTVDVTNLEPGDLVQRQSGDEVPADLRLLRAKGLQIEEAPLTGESVPVSGRAFCWSPPRCCSSSSWRRPWCGAGSCTPAATDTGGLRRHGPDRPL